MNKYDIIIIGSGLGGLECGAILSKEGYHVCVLEKNERFGGCFQTYHRNGYRMDTGIHYVGSLDEGQIMNQYFRYFGIMDKLSLKRMDETVFDRIYYKDNIYDYAMGHERFIETLCRSFPHERGNLRHYVESLRSVGELISIDHLKKGRLSEEGMNFFSTSAAGMIASATANADLQNVLAATSLLYGGIKNKSTFYEHAMINHSYLEGAYRFAEGSMQVSQELIRVIRANGGTVLNKKEVSRILVKEEAIWGVEVNHEEVIESANVISGLHPQLTLSLLEKNHSIKPAFVSRIKSLENSYGIFTLHLMMKKDCCPYLNHNIYLHGNTDVWYDKTKHKAQTPSCMISMQVPRNGNRFTEVVSVLTPMYIDELNAWADTNPEHRGEAYRHFKAQKTEQILMFLKQYGFDWSHCTERMHTTTPLSYRDYTGTIDGSAYGIVKNYQYPQISFVSTRTKLKNLFLTGQNLNVHGALGVTLTAMLTCSEFVGQEYLAKKVGHA
ncbi:NAD(P)/FAD-dependent oxidoreductase [Phocaeicola sp.]|uniref:phytoene desaturase family protein n=1 Tax=Phocaeicola sp. TaxID=2773926 RepID=UPI0023C03FEC|nr:FAD-dependent oxidoreductase [Phocaeicola sp.]MDE5678490.1 FAD-dependent oxidoreductase [Phocaeicola sp.]